MANWQIITSRIQQLRPGPPYEKALALTQQEPERQFLQERIFLAHEKN